MAFWRAVPFVPSRIVPAPLSMPEQAKKLRSGALIGSAALLTDRYSGAEPSSPAPFAAGAAST